jgi:hypothetical protein
MSADLGEIAEELYALPPEEFTAARDERSGALRSADRDLAAAVKRLKRPSRTAWALNQLAREHPSELAALFSLGAELRDASQALAGEEIRRLGQQRHRLIGELSRQLGALATEQDRPINATGEREVQATLEASVADARAAAAIGSGRLVRPLQPNGLDPVDLDGAVGGPDPDPLPDQPTPAAAGVAAAPKKRSAATKASPARKADPKAAQRIEQAERAAAEARDEADRAAGELAEADDQLATARSDRDAARNTVTELERSLRSARDDLSDAEEEVRRRQKDRQDADRANQSAQRARIRAETARVALN